MNFPPTYKLGNLIGIKISIPISIVVQEYLDGQIVSSIEREKDPIK